MRHRDASRRLSLYVVVGIVIVAVSMATAFFLLAKLLPAKASSEAPTSASTLTSGIIDKDEENFSRPAKLIIPKLAIDADVLPMGLTEEGDMESPLTNQDTGWYKYGSRPGNEGSAVIDGHFGLNGEAVFGKLSQLVPGDVISIVDDRGDKVSFSVREIKEYDRESDAEEIFNRQDGAHLNLITCNGEWEAKQATYSKRLIVFSDRIEK